MPSAGEIGFARSPWDRPKPTIEGEQRVSWNPERQPDPQTILELFAESGVVAFGSSIGDMVALPVVS